MRSCYKWMLSLLLLHTLMMAGCTDEINADLPKDRKVVVNCILTSDTVQNLSLTYSNELGVVAYDEVENATAVLYESGVEVGRFQKKSYANWKVHFQPSEGKTYTLVVEIPERPTLTAHTTFPERLPVRRMKSADTAGNRAFVVDSCGVFWTCALEKDNDTIMRPVVILPSYRLLEAIGTDYPVTDHFNMLNTDTETIDKYLTYIKMLPVKEETVFSINKLYSCVVVFLSVSDEYDQYLKSSLAKMLVYGSFDDPTQWLDESIIYNNIANGIGIFGACNETKFNCNTFLPD